MEVTGTCRVTKAVGKVVVEPLFTKLCNIKVVECSLRFGLEKKVHKGSKHMQFVYTQDYTGRLYQQIQENKLTCIKSVTDASGIGRDAHFTSCHGAAMLIGESEEHGCQRSD